MKIDYDRAKLVLLDALKIAKDGATLPIEWISHTRTVFSLEAKTWVPALGTLLLAKATDGNADTLSIKLDPANKYSYSFRGLGHKVVVPAAREHKFSIRNKGNEPLNNQPFFRYDRIDKIDRVRKANDLALFVKIAESANQLSSDEARFALAAFLSVALAAYSNSQNIKVKTNGLSPVGLRVAANDLLRFDAPDRPQRLQAFAAACLDLLFADIRTRKLNDPSRDFPGDVHVFEDSAAILAMEVRGKQVSEADLSTFAHLCADAGLHRAVMFVDAPRQRQLDTEKVSRESGLEHLQLELFECAADLLLAGLLWSHQAQDVSIANFSKHLLARLREIEVSVETLEEWRRAVAIVQAT